MTPGILNSTILASADSLARSFRAASPFPHLVMDNFLDPQFCASLLEEFPAFDNTLAMTENGTVGKKAVQQHINRLGPHYRELDETIQGSGFLTFISAITDIRELLYDPDYFGGGTHENLHGQELDPHVDFTMHPKMRAHRRLNLIVYLNHEWQREWGGNIEFHRNPRLPRNEDEIITVEPLFNRAVLFATNNISWHGFEPIQLPEEKQQLSRKSVALYFYTRKREEKIKPHSTIYVERQLPDRYQSGLTLNEGDLQELRVLLRRRDMHLERLYGNISTLMAQLEQYEGRQSLTAMNPEKIDQSKSRYAGHDRAALMQRIADLENSTSWRITAPLRKLRSLLGK